MPLPVALLSRPRARHLKVVLMHPAWRVRRVALRKDKKKPAMGIPDHLRSQNRARSTR